MAALTPSWQEVAFSNLIILMKEGEIIGMSGIVTLFTLSFLICLFAADVESLTWDQRFISLMTWWTVTCT